MTPLERELLGIATGGVKSPADLSTIVSESARVSAPLSVKEASFVAEYLVDQNGRAAALRARYPKTRAGAWAKKLLAKSYIQTAIAEALAEQQLRTRITADRVIFEIADIAFERETYDTKDRLRALEMLGKHFGILNERHELLGKDGEAFSIRVIKYGAEEPAPSTAIVSAIPSTVPALEWKA